MARKKTSTAKKGQTEPKGPWKEPEEVPEDKYLLGNREESDEDIENKAKALVTEVKRRDNPWGITSRAQQSVKLAMAALSTKNGMHARVPLVCKGEGCPYSDQCPLLPYDMAPIGEYCAVEIAQIDLRANGYAKDIDFDTASFTDKNLLSELIMLDVMLERCKALMAKDGTPVIDMAIGVDSEGNEIRQPAVSKAWEAYEKISKKRDQTYQLLMMTRKDKSKSKDEDEEGSSVSKALYDALDTISVTAEEK